jgi:hypothetical protein
MGEGESETTDSPFQSMKAVERTSAKLRTCAASCRGFMSERPSLVVVGVGLGVEERVVGARLVVFVVMIFGGRAGGSEGV